MKATFYCYEYNNELALRTLQSLPSAPEKGFWW